MDKHIQVIQVQSNQNDSSLFSMTSRSILALDHVSDDDFQFVVDIDPSIHVDPKSIKRDQIDRSLKKLQLLDQTFVASLVDAFVHVFVGDGDVVP